MKGSLGTCQSSGNGSSNGDGEFGNCSRPPIPSDLEISCSSGGFQIKIFKFLYSLIKVLQHVQLDAHQDQY